MNTLPNHIRASRQGLGQSEYDAYGELAPIQWRCRCGSVIFLERMDYKAEAYVQTPSEILAEFLEQHNSCTKSVHCYSCRTVEVERYGDWCDNCSDSCSDWG